MLRIFEDPSMSDSTPSPLSSQAGPHEHEHTDGFEIDPTADESVDSKLAEIEMIGEEAAIGKKPSNPTPISADVRFLHVSRTIHQLITDRNRSVGIFLLVASVLINASAGLLKTELPIEPIIPLQAIRYWCLPVTFGCLAVLGGFTSLLLIRARIGLIYEVAKMNVLLGIGSKRVERVNPLSIFYIMHLMVAVLAGASAGFTWGMLVLPHGGVMAAGAQGLAVGLMYVLALQALYYITILRNTTDVKLQSVTTSPVGKG